MREARLETEPDAVHAAKQRRKLVILAAAENSRRAGQIGEQFGLSLEERGPWLLARAFERCLPALGEQRANSGDIGQNLVAGLEPVVALDDNRLRVVARESIIEKIERLLADRMGVRVGEDGGARAGIAH